MDVFIDQSASGGLELQGYNLHVLDSGGHRGQLAMIDAVIDAERKDYVFQGAPDNMFAAGAANRVAGSILTSLTGVATQERGYLATFTYRVSADAAGAFVVDADDWVSRADNLEQTFFIATGNAKIEVTSTTPAVIVVRPGPAKHIR